MSPWRDTILAFSAVPEIAPLLLSPDAAWIWSRDGSRVLWANPAGGARLGVSQFIRLWKRHWPEKHPLRRTLASLARALPERGTLARLRLTDDLHGAPVACRCRYVRAGAERGVLLVAIDDASARPSLAALAAFLSDFETGAAIVGENGALLAGGAPDLQPVDLDDVPIALEDAGRKLRLYFVERTLPSIDEISAPARTIPAFEIDAVPPPPAASIASPPPRSAPPTEEAARTMRASEGAAAAGSRRPAPVPKPEAREPDQTRPIVAGRVPRELSRQPVRFLWQTDASERFLFVSPGLAQVVGRNAEIGGERWQDASARLRLDPTGRIARALQQHDTWSGLTAWWPVEGSNVRVPAELTGLPVFGADHSFQGYRGFGVLKPAEALMPAAFEARFGTADRPVPRPAEQLPPYEEAMATQPAKVVPIRTDLERTGDQARLTPQERSAFEEIAAALHSRVVVEPVETEEDADAAPAAVEEPNVAADQPVEPDVAAPPVVRLLRRVADALSDDATAPALPPAELNRPEETKPPAEPTLREPPAIERPRPKPAEATPVAAAKPETPVLERRSAILRDRLSDAERRLREMTAILDTATDGVVILDAAGMIESVNASAEALFGLDARELEGAAFVDLLTGESRKSALDYLSGLKDSGVASLLNEGREVEAQAGIGSIPLFMTMGRISSEEGGRFCAVLRDITHWKRTEAELLSAKRAAEEASRHKSDFLARVSHEVRTPLNAIIGFAEVMIEERFGPVEHERYREYLRDIRTSGEHVVSLVNDLLDISKIEAGKLDLTFVAVPLNDLVRESIGLMQPQANRAHVVLRSSLSRDVPAIVADQRTLRQIVLNLLSNSVKFTGPGGQVIASTSLAETGEAHLRIRDTGEGMSEDELARALEPFRQLATASLADRTGTGLGLPLTKALVEANRASLSIRSARGEGTVVTVTFPPTRVLSE